jgi:hypothetical protein
MVRDFRNHLFLVGIVLVLFLLVGCASQMFAVRETVTVTIRETSDLHGPLLPTTVRRMPLLLWRVGQ